MALSLWLGFTVDGFGAWQAGLGVAYGVALAVALVLLSRCGGRFGVTVSLLLFVLALLVGVGDGASWFMQGSSFNERFFAHVDVHNVAVSIRAYALAIGLGVLAMLVLLGSVLRVLVNAGRRPVTRWAWLPVGVLLLLVVSVNAAPRRLYHYFTVARQTEALSSSTVGGRIRAMIDPYPSSPAAVRAKPGRNLVLVYLESLERTYTDARRFPGLTPNIDRWRRQGLDFSGMRTFPGATYTIAGLFSSQCGTPYLINSVFGNDINALGFVPGNDSASIDSFHPELACLGDVLHAAGYRQTYLSGVSLQFANTDQFFHMHQYDAALGAPQIQHRHAGALPKAGWGLLDTVLFDEALAEYRRGVASGRPFGVVFSTIDTHPPEGYTLPGCRPYAPIHNKMLDAVHCSDQLLGQFLDTLSREPGWKDTVVAVMSDHLAMRNVASVLYPPDIQRQPLLFVLNAGTGDRPARMYHMDVAPTLLDVLGVRSNVRFMAGADKAAAAAPDNPLPADDVAQAVLRDALWADRKPPEPCAGNQLVGWNPQRNIDIGGWSLPFMRGGWHQADLEDDHVLLVFVDGHDASLQMLPFGTQERWLEQAREQHKQVFLAIPFWRRDGKRMLALRWVAANGAWASLGMVAHMSDVNLRSPHCRALLRALNTATGDARRDFSSAFGTQSLSADGGHLPGEMPSQALPAVSSVATNAQFMFQRMAARQQGDVTLRISPAGQIFMPPAKNHAGWIEFDVSGMASLTLAPRINPLTAGCKANPEAGVVGVRITLDGRPLRSRFIVNRDHTRPLVLDVSGARRLRVEVDQGNATTNCDWFSIGFPALALKSAAGDASVGKASR